MNTMNLRFQKSPLLESIFENLRFWCRKTPVTCERSPYSEKKVSVLENTRLYVRVDGASDARNLNLELGEGEGRREGGLGFCPVTQTLTRPVYEENFGKLKPYS